jgi:protocatechuate 3,4-dioxygenase beta subunit
MKPLAILRHRFVAVPLLLAAVTLVWNAYVALNDDGIISGTVADAAGRPIAGATVVFYERSMLNYVEQRHVVTDVDGTYRFDGMAVHIGQLEARTADGRNSERRQLRLWFRSQNTRVAPLVVAARQ